MAYPDGATPLDPDELGGLKFHHKLVQIHVFANGNGRHVRIMADTLFEIYLSIPTNELAWRMFTTC